MFAQSSQIALLSTLMLSVSVGCASTEEGRPTTAPAEVEPTAGATAGGEQEPPEPSLRATTPVPVPQPAVPREELGSELQQVWEAVETAVAIRPPEPPTDSGEEALQAWAEGPFLSWLNERRRAMAEANARVSAMSEASPHERGVAAGLLGYMYEDMASGIRGAPVPDAVASDPELLQVYVEALNGALAPYATLSAQAYLVCAQGLVSLGEQSPWFPWAAYCDERGAEVVEVFRLPVEDDSEGDGEGAGAGLDSAPPRPDPRGNAKRDAQPLDIGSPAAK